MSDELNIVDLANLELPEEIVTLNNNQKVRVVGVPYNELLTVFKDNVHYLDLALRGDPRAVTELLEEQPKKMAYLIAYATGNTDKAAVEVALKIPTHYQAKLIMAIFRLTFPDGEALGKFMAEVEALLKQIVTGSIQQKVVMSMLASGTKLPKR